MKTVCIIPAAGRGSRAKLDFPKCLFEVDGKPILLGLIEKISPFFDAARVIVSPSGLSPIKDAVKIYNDKQVLFCVQNHPLGMGHAIYVGLRSLDLNDVDRLLIVWADCLGLTASTVKNSFEYADLSSADLFFPTRIVNKAYTRVERDRSGNFRSVIETRVENLE